VHRLSDYTYRYWEGEPTTGDGITHAAGIDIDLDVVAICGRVCSTMNDYEAPRTQLVTCLRCWARMIRSPHLFRDS
jgi:hypothetical protein